MLAMPMYIAQHNTLHQQQQFSLATVCRACRSLQNGRELKIHTYIVVVWVRMAYVARMHLVIHVVYMVYHTYMHKKHDKNNFTTENLSENI